MQQLIEQLLALDNVRYAAVYQGGKLLSREKAGLVGASASESDKYEEVIVNPTVLKLVQQRGSLDCGGARFVVIRYGNFWQIIQPIEGGHVSVAVEPAGDPLCIQPAVQSLLEKRRWATNSATS